MGFEANLRKLKKDIKKASVDTYFRNIKRLRKQTSDEPIPLSSTWLTSKKLLAWYDKEPLSVRRHLATAAVVAMKVYGKNLEQWTSRHNKSIDEYEKDRKTRTLSDKQKKMIPTKGFDALKRAITNMRKTLRHVLNEPIDSLKNLLRVQDYLILNLYENYPIRLDYATLKIGKFDDNNCIYRQKKKPAGWYMKLVDYKTAKKMGEKTFKFNVSNQRLLSKFIRGTEKLTNHGYLLTNRAGKKMSRQTLSKRLMKITSEKIGKKFSVQLLRILYAMKNRGIIETAKEVSEKLMHSPEQSLMYAKKSEK